MYRFERTTSLEAPEYEDPGIDERSGPPLSQGFIIKLVNMVASEYLTEDMQYMIDDLQVDVWYHGQVLEALLTHIEEQSPDIIVDIGKNVYYGLQHKFMEIGLKTPNDVITTMPMLWQNVTRGQSGEWRTDLQGEGKAYVEFTQPYNCQFEKGALMGSLQCFGAENIEVEETKCMRNGDTCCAFNVTWSE